MDTKVIQNVKDKKFSEFGDAIKQELKNKLANNPTIKKHVEDYEKVKNLKDAFAQINKDNQPEQKEDESEIDKDENSEGDDDSQEE